MSKPDLVEKLRAVMPEESTVDLEVHAEKIADAVTQAREKAAALREKGEPFHEVRRDDELLEDHQWHARKHFPHLSPSVAPRESDEYPTYWEE